MTLHYHAFLRERLGRESELLAVECRDATAAGIVAAFVDAHPEFARLAGALNVAINDEIVARNAAVPIGARVDLLPPYGGGQCSAPLRDATALRREALLFFMSNIDAILLTRSPLDVQALDRLVADPGAGAIVSFAGLTRDNHLGRRVLGLEYEAHEALAQKMLERLRADAMQRFGLVRAALHHRLGRVEIGEASVVIAVSAPHRGEAFDGCRFLIDELKTTVPIWKKEYYADGSAPEWVGPDGKPVSI